MLSKIKDEFKDTLIAFGGKGSLRLGQRQDLDALAIMAHKSGNKNLLKLFEVLPSLDKLEEDAMDSKLEKLMPKQPATQVAGSTVPQKEAATSEKVQ